MIEVFKTNVMHHDHALVLVREIHKIFRGYEANFDLEDCDRILRIKSHRGAINAKSIIAMLQRFGVDAEVLPDEVVPRKVISPPFCLAFRMMQKQSLKFEI